ncbi:MAG: DUF1998 domain-containing protein [Microcoleaceae cyanobacterium]
MTNEERQNYRVGELRPSQILFSFGIGAMVDLPNLSAIVMGSESWNDKNTVQLTEERLLAAVQCKLGRQVNRLLSPPMPPQQANSDNAAYDHIGIPVTPFPSWMVCSKCRLLGKSTAGYFKLKGSSFRPSEIRYVHHNCTKSKNKPPTVIPVRFLAACEHGHLDDFPWDYFVHQGISGCNGRLHLNEYGISGAASDIEVRCSCGASRRLSDAFGQRGKENLPACRGRHPHLQDFDDDCEQQMVAMLLGASNSWFGISLSAISLPTGTHQLEQLVKENWASLQIATSLETTKVVLDLLQTRGELGELARYQPPEIWEIIEKVKSEEIQEDSAQDLKTPEWEVFSHPHTVENTKHFEISSIKPPTGYEAYFTQTVLVEKLREVRSLIGFTRIQSPGDFDDAGDIPEEYQVSLSRNKPDWVPTTEVKGEGIFLQFKEDVLQAWEALPSVKNHAGKTFKAQQRWAEARDIELESLVFPGSRFLVLHSFAHVLMRQFALECGYNAASLRERIYSKPPEDENEPQAGILIYTAAPDSEGTLGGLVNLGKPEILGDLISQALEEIELCASDPMCAEHNPNNGMPSLHWAACHACLFAPETSCERGNKFLDRNVLVSTLKQNSQDLAFFHHVIE